MGSTQSMATASQRRTIWPFSGHALKAIRLFSAQSIQTLGGLIWSLASNLFRSSSRFLNRTYNGLGFSAGFAMTLGSVG